MPRTQVHSEGRSLSSSGFFRFFMAVDILLLLSFIGWGIWYEVTDADVSVWVGWGAVAYAALTLPVAVRCLGLWAGALVWRRRLSLVPVVAVLVRGSPIAEIKIQLGVVLYTMILWIVMLLESKRVALAVAEATGEEVYKVDPTRRVD